jgi:hypothetical protein
MAGLLHGLKICGLTTVNNPEDPRYKNTTDVASGGKEKTANLLADFRELDGLIPFNDETLLGAVEALREAGRLGEVAMVSRNGTPAAVELVRAGVHGGTWDIDPPGPPPPPPPPPPTPPPPPPHRPRPPPHGGTWDIDPPGIGQTVAGLITRIVVDHEDLDGLCVASPIGRMITPERAATWVPWQQRITYRPLLPGP